MKYSHLAMLVSLSILSACANKGQNGAEADAGFASATQSLNERNYSAAITSLEALKRQYPESKEIRRKLMHAHAGLAGFEAAAFKEKVERLAAKAEKFKGKSLKEEFESFRRDLRAGKDLDASTLQKFRVYRVTGELRELMDDLPTLSKEQFSHLNQAIHLYEEMGVDPSANSPDDNFRWGTLHAYRVTVTLKHVVVSLDEIARNPQGQSRGDVERMLVSAGDQMWRDSLSAYKLFKHSYTKVRTVSAATERFVEKTTGYRLRGELMNESNDVADILRSFVQENKEQVSALVARFEDFAEMTDVDGTLKRAFSELREESPEVQYRKMRIRAITQVFINELKESRGGEIAEAKYLSQNFFRELSQAFREAKEAKRLSPVQQLLRNERGELHRLVEIGRLLLNDVKDSNIRAELKPEVTALADLVDRQQLEILKATGETLATEAKILGVEYRAGLIDLTRITEERLRARGKSTEELLKGELGEEYRAFRSSLHMKDEDLEAGIRKQKAELKEMGQK
jgi:hypothetical protein